jgi:hypothetical protein
MCDSFCSLKFRNPKNPSRLPGASILLILWGVVQFFMGCNRESKTPPIMEPSPTSPPTPGPIGATDGEKKAPPGQERESPAEPRTIFVITKQRIKESPLSIEAQDLLTKKPEDYGLQLTADPPVFSTQTNFPSPFQEENLWTVRIPPFQGSLEITINLVQLNTNVPLLTSTHTLKESDLHSNQKWIIQWQKPKVPQGGSIGKEPKISILQRWNGLQDSNGTKWKISPSSP